MRPGEVGLRFPAAATLKCGGSASGLSKSNRFFAEATFNDARSILDIGSPSRDNIEEATIEYLFQVDKSDATRRAIFDVFPLRLIGNGSNVGEFKEPMRFDVIRHFIAPCCFVVVGYPELWPAE